MTETVNSCSLDLQTVSAELATTKAVCESDTRCTSGPLEVFKPVQPIQPSQPSVSAESSDVLIQPDMDYLLLSLPDKCPEQTEYW